MGGGGSLLQLDKDNYNCEEEEDFNRERDEDIRERKRTMRTSYMVNKIQETPQMLQVIRGKRKDQHNRGALDKDEINKRMDKFGVDPTAMLKR